VLEYVSTFPNGNESKVEANCGNLFCCRDGNWCSTGQPRLKQLSTGKTAWRSAWSRHKHWCFWEVDVGENCPRLHM